ncbi:MAG: prepilin-type N-terminal cleavage/methylation domain-containing protein [bacterium]
MKKAFTLIELMIVVAIVAFLAAISVPQYFKYIARARQAEVAMNLASLHTAQQAYYAEHGQYNMILNGEGGIDWKPAGYKGGGKQENFYYTYGFNFPGAQEGIHYFTGKLVAPKEILGESYAKADGFLAKAAGDILGKGDPDIWQVDETRTIKNVHKGIN